MLLLALLCACGGAPLEPANPAPPAPGEWATWSHARKFNYMTTTVLPKARELFAAYEPARYVKFTCAYCHGAGARDGTYKMPNPDLPHIAGAAAGFGELATREHDVLKFMQSTLVPETAKLLNVPSFDMEKHVGFSCYQCHTRTDR
jgi:cytochrome c553